MEQWIIDYNNKNYQSSAGKAIKILMDQLEKERKIRTELVDALKGISHYCSKREFDDVMALIQKANNLSA